MADIAFVAVIVAFFLLCVGYASLCGRIIGADDVQELEEIDEPIEAVALERAA